MIFRTMFWPTLACSVALVAGSVKGSPVATNPASEIPHLRKQGTATQLIVDGKPFLALAGELGNNTATSLEYMKPVWPKLVDTKLNSVLAAVSWAQIEPAEGKFNFHVLDGVIREARNHNLRLVLLWFASWKNGQSSYAPDWVKRDFERFPRAQNAAGRSIELLSPIQRGKPRRRCPRLCSPDAARQSRGWPAAYGHHGSGGERTRRAGLPRPLAPGHQGLRRAGAQGTHGLPYSSTRIT